MEQLTTVQVHGILLVVVSFALNGCATYVEPIEGPTAVLSARGAIDALKIGYEGKCGNVETVPTDLLKSFRIRAGQQVTIRMSRHGPSSSACNGEGTFFAVVGREYRLLAEHAGNYTCRAEMQVKNPSGSWRVEPTFYIQDARTCLAGEK